MKVSYHYSVCNSSSCSLGLVCVLIIIQFRGRKQCPLFAKFMFAQARVNLCSNFDLKCRSRNKSKKFLYVTDLHQLIKILSLAILFIVIASENGAKGLPSGKTLRPGPLNRRKTSFCKAKCT